jgi:TP901 family phage tail tape measure protein
MANTVQLEAILKLTGVQIDRSVFTQISRATAGLPGALADTGRAATKANTGMRRLGRGVRDVKTELTNGERAARQFLQRMAQFAILLPTFATLNRALQGGVRFLVDFEAEIRKIQALDIDGLADSFGAIADQALKIGTEFGSTATEVVQGIRLFKQAGATIEEAFEQARVSTLAARTSTLDLAESQEFVVALTQIFGDQAGDLESALDKVVKVEDLAAAGAQDIAEAFRTGGNALAFATKSVDDTIGLIAALREQTRKSGREVGTFFKTLSTRITAAGEPQQAVRALGVEVKNLDGSLRPLIDVLGDLENAFNNLTEAEQANAAKSIAGVRQFESFLGVIKSFDRATELSAAASNADGAAKAKQAVIAESLEFQLTQLTTASQGLAQAIGDAGIGDVLKGAVGSARVLVGVATKLVQIFDKIGVSVAPLLAIGGIRLGRAVFGLGGFGGVGGGGAGGKGGKGGLPAIPGVQKTSQELIQMQTATDQATRGLQLFNQQLLIRKNGVRVLEDRPSARRLQTAVGRDDFKDRTRQRLSVEKSIQANNKWQAAIGDSRVQLLAFTAASIAAVPVLNGLTSAFDSIVPAAFEIGDNFRKAAGFGLQTGLQFGILGAKAGLVAGTLATLGSVISDTVDRQKEQSDAIKELVGLEFDEAKIQGAITDLSGSLGQIIAENLSSSLNEQEFGDVDVTGAFDKLLEDFESLGATGLDTGKLQRALFSDEGNRNIAKLNNELFANAEAAQELKDAYDENGDSTLSLAERSRILLRAFGVVDKQIDETTGLLKETFAPAFEDIKNFAEAASRFTTLNASLADARTLPENLAQGIDRLRVEAERADQAFLVAQKGFNDLRQSLLESEAPEAGIGPGRAISLLGEVRSAFAKEGDALVQELERINNSVLASERDFVSKVIAIEGDAKQAEIDRLTATQTLRQSILDREKELAQAQQAASLEAGRAADDFAIALIEFGGNAENALSSIEKLANLTEVEKAQIALQQSSVETAVRVERLRDELFNLQDEFSKVENAAEGTEGAFVRNELQLKMSAKQLEIENLQREGVINTIKGRIKVAQEEAKAAEEARKAEEKRLKLLQELEDATDSLNDALEESKQSFEEFADSRRADLADLEADAQSNLKSAQQETLDATENLANAFANLQGAILDFNGAVTEAEITTNLINRDIAILTGGISTFSGRLASLEAAFTDALGDANISLEQRIALERQLANETLAFLQEAESQITQAGLGIFGQSAEENAALQQGIDGLAFIAEKLGGSFENFLGLSGGELDSLSKELLNLPLEFRQQILDALSFLPDSASIGGFSVEQLEKAIGQIGAGVAPEVGLPSLEELTTQQVEQLQILQSLSQQEAALAFEQVKQAQEQVAIAEEQLEAAKILEERAREELGLVREGIAEEIAVLEAANQERIELTNRVIAADDRNTLKQIEREAKLFAEQNKVFGDVGKSIVDGITSVIGARLSQLEAAAAVGSLYAGYIPNFAGGNLTPSEAAGLLRAAQREKNAMPAGAGLAVANTSEAIIPMRKFGFVPNFQDGSPIAAGIDAVRGINETVVAAIARSVTQALSQLETGGSESTDEILERVVNTLESVRGELNDIALSNTAIQTQTASLTDTDTAASSPTTGENVSIQLDTNQNQTITVTGLDSLVDEIRDTISASADEQTTSQLDAITEQLEAVFTVLRERGLLSSFGQPG